MTAEVSRPLNNFCCSVLKFQRRCWATGKLLPKNLQWLPFNQKNQTPLCGNLRVLHAALNGSIQAGLSQLGRRSLGQGRQTLCPQPPPCSPPPTCTCSRASSWICSVSFSNYLRLIHSRSTHLQHSLLNSTQLSEAPLISAFPTFLENF